MISMSKTKLFLDFDNTIVNTSSAFCEVYNDIFFSHKDFKTAKWWENTKYNFSDICPLLKEHNISIFSIFEQENFFKGLDFINGNTQEIIQKLTEKYQVIICSIGTPNNISLKSLWIEKNIPEIKECIFLTQSKDNFTMNKSMVNMESGILIDDVVSNLDSSNADLKLVFGDEYEWNTTTKYSRAYNWTAIGDILLGRNFEFKCDYSKPF